MHRSKQKYQRVGLQAEFDQAYERAKEKLLKRREQTAKLVPLEEQYNLICEAVDEPKAGKKGRVRS